MRVVFLFMAQGNATPGTSTWKPDHPCDEKYHRDFAHEGYFKLMGDLLEKGVINELCIFYESNRGHGVAKWVDHPNAFCAVVPEIRFVEKYLTEDCVIFVRGGFKHWHDWLLKRKYKNWLMLYSANTGRQRWNWWDIILDDMTMRSRLDGHDRLWIPFIKPIDDDFFTPLGFTPENTPPQIDIMMGASHVHDKKGQWRVLKVLQAYEKKYGRRPTAVLPGAPRRGVMTNWLLEEIQNSWNIPMVGHLNRSSLRILYNSCRIALFLGAHGQNDRGPLEALSCGTPVMLGSPSYHSSELRRIPSVFTLNDVNNFKSTAQILSFLDQKDTGSNKTFTALEFRKKLGYKKSFSWMSYLFSFLEIQRTPTKIAKEALLNTFKELKEYGNTTNFS